MEQLTLPIVIPWSNTANCCKMPFEKVCWTEYLLCGMECL